MTGRSRGEEKEREREKEEGRGREREREGEGETGRGRGRGRDREREKEGGSLGANDICWPVRCESAASKSHSLSSFRTTLRRVGKNHGEQSCCQGRIPRGMRTLI